MNTRYFVFLSLLIFSILNIQNAKADSYPNRVVRIIVPYPPGGSAEIQARLIGQKLSEIWKQPVIIENKPGAGTTLAASYVSKSLADGYTLYFISTSHTVSPSLYKNLSYDPVKSFTPISLIGTSPFVLTVRADENINSLKQIVELSKTNPGKYTYSSSGIGAGPHLSAELLKSIAGINIVHIPYKGSSPAMAALIGGEVDFFMGDISISSFVKTGKLKAIAVTTLKRSPLFENVPTIAESGYSNYETINWSGIVAPAGIPSDITKFINESIQTALSTSNLRSKYLAQGVEPMTNSPDEFEKFLINEVAKYSKIIKDADIRID
jgi:tripartite-type tricarboxylate transporter receptor subunit TctC